MPDAKGFGGRKRPRSEEAVELGEIVDGLLREQVFSRGMPVARLASRSSIGTQRRFHQSARTRP